MRIARLRSSQFAVRVKEVVDAEQIRWNMPVRYRSFEDRSRIRLGNGIRLMAF